jgi:carbonic anhydrase
MNKTASLSLCVVLCIPLAFAEGGHHFGYSGAVAPEHWAELSPEYAACAAGKHQSPVNIGKSDVFKLQALKFGWLKGKYGIVNNGHSIQLVAPKGGTLIAFDGRTYELVQLHFHAPSEHARDGKAAPMEIHFVHKEKTSGELLVIGVFVADGGKNTTFAKIMAAAPKEEGNETAELTLDPKALLPTSRSYWSYDGSLTTPPCSEPVKWVVLKTAIKVADSDIVKFKAIYPANARPVQPLNARTIKSSP